MMAPIIHHGNHQMDMHTYNHDTLIGYVNANWATNTILLHFAAWNAANLILLFRSSSEDMHTSQQHNTISNEDYNGTLRMANEQQPIQTDINTVLQTCVHMFGYFFQLIGRTPLLFLFAFLKKICSIQSRIKIPTLEVWADENHNLICYSVCKCM